MSIPNKILGKTNLKISLLGLGTAEIGRAYGINQTELISEKNAIDFLQKAVEIGITYFDSAYFYGLSEERIAKSKITQNSNIVIGTKCAKFLEDNEILTPKEQEARIRQEVESSRKRLNIDLLPLVYLHGGSKEQIENWQILEIINSLKKENKIKFIGISLRGVEAAKAAIESDFFDVIQVAYSILDQRMADEILPLAKSKNIGVVNRSVLLKGSLTNRRQYLHPSLNQLKENADKAEKVAQELGITLPELAIRFNTANPNIDTILIGTNNISHLNQSIKAIQAGPLSEDIIKDLNTLAIDEPKIVDPKNWPQ